MVDNEGIDHPASGNCKWVFDILEMFLVSGNFFSFSSQFSGHNFASGIVSAAMRILHTLSLSLFLSILNISLHTKFVLSASSSRDVTKLWSFLKRNFFFLFYSRIRGGIIPKESMLAY